MGHINKNYSENDRDFAAYMLLNMMKSGMINSDDFAEIDRLLSFVLNATSRVPESNNAQKAKTAQFEDFRKLFKKIFGEDNGAAAFFMEKIFDA
jgi:hypothetical protein